jgi:hypothetical protein
LCLEIIVCKKISTKGVKTHFLWFMHHHVSWWGVATLDSTWPRHITYPREASPDESKRDTWTTHGLEGPRGPKLTQNVTFTQELPKVPHTSHHAKGEGELGPRGFERANLVAIHPVLTRGGCPLVLKAIPGCFTASWGSNLGCPRTINRRGGGWKDQGKWPRGLNRPAKQIKLFLQCNYQISVKSGTSAEIARTFGFFLLLEPVR